MTDEQENGGRVIADNAARLVAAYVLNNRVATSELQHLITLVGVSLSNLIANSPQFIGGGPALPTQAQIRESITPEGLISFLDGKPYKVLRKHLSVYGLTPASYCTRFGLPSNYPMVASSYSERRAAISLQMQLDRSKRT